MADHADLADLSKLETNDISATLQYLGVEAARAALGKEVRAVFGAYGIAVDARHLSLIADFMTAQACRRSPGRSSVSELIFALACVAPPRQSGRLGWLRGWL